MRVLLINSNRFHQPWPVMPFGLCCVASATEAAGHEVRVLDLCFSSRPGDEIRETLAAFHPEVVGVSIRNIDNVAALDTKFLLTDVRDDVVVPLKMAFEGPIVIGGAAVGINGKEILDFLDLEYAVRGDGELGMVAFLKWVENGMKPAARNTGPAGLIIRTDGYTLTEAEPARVRNLDSLPRPQPHRWVDVARYQKYNSPLQVQTKRGCALKCSYCTYNAIEGKHWRLRDPERVADEIEALVESTGIRSFEFTDSTFNIPLAHSKAVLRAIIARNLRLEVRAMGLNPGAVDEELIDLMKQVGFREVDLGAESACDVTLEGLGKSFRKQHILRAARRLRDAKIPVTWCLLLGGPHETEETVRETLSVVNEAASPWDLIDIGIGLRVYNGSPIAEAENRANPVCSKDRFLRPVAFRPKGIALNDLRTLVREVALQRDNYFLFGEDETATPAMLKLGAWLVRHLAPRQPIWRLLILLRKLRRALGFGVIQRFLRRPDRNPRVNQTLDEQGEARVNRLPEKIEANQVVDSVA